MKKASGLLHRTLPGLAVFSVALAAAAWQASRYDFVSDDAFISLRYARNFLDGQGLVFNPGERVEGYTNFLFILLTAGLSALGADLLAAARSIGVVATALLALTTGAVIRRLVGPGWEPYGLLGGGALLANPYVAIWSAGGLETPLYSLLVMALALALLAERPGRTTFLVVAALGLLLALTRPEGAGLFVVAAAWCALSWPLPLRARVTAMLPGLLLFLAALGLFEWWRLWYYGDWLPNTFYAKSDFSARQLARGAEYLTAFSRNGYVPAALGLGALGLALRRRRENFVPFVLFLALLAGVVGVGGDGLPAYRFMVPLLAPLFAVAMAGLATLSRALERSLPVAKRLPLVLALALAVWSTQAVRDPYYKLYLTHRNEVANWTKVGRWLRASLPPTATVAAVPIGALSYYSGLRVIDMVGLTDRHIARSPVADTGEVWPGHERHDGPYVLSREPDVLLLANISVGPEPSTDLRRIYSTVGRAVVMREKDVYKNPLFTRDYRPAAFALGDGTYLHAFVRSRGGGEATR